MVTPHAQYFIGDQLKAIEKQVSRVSVLMPSPFFSGLALRVPFAPGRYASLRRAQESAQRIPSDNLLRPGYLDLPGDFTRRLTDPFAARSSARAVSRRGTSFDLVHSHFLGLHALLGLRLKQTFGRPMVLTVYGGDAYSVPFRGRYNRSLAETVLAGADRLIAVSKPLAQNLVSLGADASRIAVIPTGFDGSLFAPAPQESARSRLGLPPGKRILLAVANLVPQKGHGCLLESFKALASAREDLALVLLGGGPLERELRARVKELGLGDSVLFAGPRPHGEIATWINACDALVLSSISEGSPTVIPEAMACGKPVVATKVGGIPDLVREGEQGYLVPPGDAVALADALTRAIDTRWSAEEIRKRALSYSWDSLASEIVGVYAAASESYPVQGD